MKGRLLSMAVIRLLHGEDFDVHAWFHLHAEQEYKLPIVVSMEFV